MPTAARSSARRHPWIWKRVTGVERLVTMAALALAECATKHDSPAAVLLCLPSRVDDAFVPADVLAALAGEARFPVDHAASRAFAGGRAAVFQALAEAERLLSTRRVDAVYLGGADSLIDVEPLDRALRAGLLKIGAAEGFVPGEGAALVRLGLAGDEATLGLVTGLATASEPAPRGAAQPNSGQGLAQAGRAALADARLGNRRGRGFPCRRLRRPLRTARGGHGADATSSPRAARARGVVPSATCNRRDRRCGRPRSPWRRPRSFLYRRVFARDRRRWCWARATGRRAARRW